ncbi:unnamed protein product [Caenorhabditis sp. 36 PRJEB53466]|nr:unnamed protein product [Caenorhabditis sp. 36 PRJEB53466]
MNLQLLCCHVCGAEGVHGNHFGATSCRACAAFFRRTAFSKWTNAKCRGGSCDRSVYFCKPCRLQRCFDVGMKTSNFQYNRDGLRNATLKEFQKNPAQTVAGFVGRPEMVLFWDSNAPTHKTMIDVRCLIVEAAKVLNQCPEMVYVGSSQLHRLAFGMKVIRSGESTQEARRIVHTTQKEVSATWQHYFLTVAKWLMHFEEFQKLDRSVQFSLLQCVWHIWATLERHAATAIHRKNNANAPKTEIISRRGVIIDLANVHFDATWLSDYPSRQIAHFLRQSSRDHFGIIGSLIELEPTEMEMTYMLAQLCFEYAGKRYQGEILKVTERFQDILANDLHDYYVNELRMVKYFDRLTKLMKVNNAIQKNLWEHRPRMEVAKLFNIIKIEFSHPEMFKDSGFN